MQATLPHSRLEGGLYLGALPDAPPRCTSSRFPKEVHEQNSSPGIPKRQQSNIWGCEQLCVLPKGLTTQHVTCTFSVGARFSDIWPSVQTPHYVTKITMSSMLAQFKATMVSSLFSPTRQDKSSPVLSTNSLEQMSVPKPNLVRNPSTRHHTQYGPHRRTLRYVAAAGVLPSNKCKPVLVAQEKKHIN